MLSFLEFLIEIQKDNPFQQNSWDHEVLRRFARKKGVNLNINDTDYNYNSMPNHWNVELLKRMRGEKGSGAKVMKGVSKLADRDKKTVTLKPAIEGGEKLRNYYDTFGYKSIGGNVMKREPK